MTVVTLTTDFGFVDSYVAQMKGVLLGLVPDAVLVDVTHDIPPQDIRRGAWLLAELPGAFPPGTLHVAVVDPGVGTARPLVGVEAGGQRFLAPNNGLLSRVLAEFPPTRMHQLTEPRFWRAPVSPTFHGRDILASVAGHWLRGCDLSEFGPALPALGVSCDTPPRREAKRLLGEVVAIDRFGNLLTNIPQAWIPEPARAGALIEVGRQRLQGIARCYGERTSNAPGDAPVESTEDPTEPADVLALFSSQGRLEIAVVNGSASEELGVRVGERVVVRLS